MFISNVRRKTNHFGLFVGKFSFTYHRLLLEAFDQCHSPVFVTILIAATSSINFIRPIDLIRKVKNEAP